MEEGEGKGKKRTTKKCERAFVPPTSTHEAQDKQQDSLLTQPLKFFFTLS